MSENNFGEIFKNFITVSGLKNDNLESIFLELDLNPPFDYVSVLRYTNGGEGFLRESYLRLFSINTLISINNAYQIKRFTPGLILFGSNGGGDAFCFDTRKDPVEIIQVPFIPMDFKYAELLGKSFLEFLQKLQEVDNSGAKDLPQINKSAFGKEIHEIQPVVFGGDPVDNKNKILVEQEAHAELSVFWNKVYQREVYGKE